MLAAAALLAGSGAPPGLPLWLTIETPRGVLASGVLAGAHPAVAGLVAGTSDLTKELRARHVPGREPLLYSLSAIVLAARAHGLAALDGVHLALDDESGLRRLVPAGARPRVRREDADPPADDRGREPPLRPRPGRGRGGAPAARGLARGPGRGTRRRPSSTGASSRSSTRCEAERLVALADAIAAPGPA